LSNSMVLLSLIRNCCRLVPGSFIPISLRSWCLKPRPLMPLLHSWPFHSLSPCFRRFGVPRFVWFLVQSFLTSFSLRHDTVGRQVVFLPATVSLFRGPHFPWVPILLKRFIFCHATLPQLDTFLQAEANFLPAPQSPRVISFGPSRRPAAGFLPLCRFFRPLTGFTTASSLGAT
jgi:hypothetical protein